MWAPLHTLSRSTSLTFGSVRIYGRGSALWSRSGRFKTGRQRYKANRGQGRSKPGQAHVYVKWIRECVWAQGVVADSNLCVTMCIEGFWARRHMWKGADVFFMHIFLLKLKVKSSSHDEWKKKEREADRENGWHAPQVVTCIQTHMMSWPAWHAESSNRTLIMLLI